MTSSASPTQGVQLKRGNGGSPETFTLIGEIYTFDGPGGQAADIDVTSFDSTSKEFLVGLQDEGEVTFEMNFVKTDAQQAGLISDRTAQTLRNFQLRLMDTAHTTLSFAARVKGFALKGQKEDAVRASVTLRLSGAVSYS